MSTEQIITPWIVQSDTSIDYTKLIKKFDCSPIDNKIIERFEKVTKTKAHMWLRRGIFFSHRDLDVALDAYEKGEQVYLYTGRGPSSEMHLGHMVPFMFTKYLQDAFNAIVIIQLSVEEKFYFKGGELEKYCNLARDNAKDIIACGFDVDKTWIFSNLDAVGGEFYKNIVRLQSVTKENDVKSIFGLTLNNNIGELSWPCYQAAPAFSTSFPELFDRKHVTCIVPMAIDQDPYFRLARDFSKKYKDYKKPVAIHSRFLPSLDGVNSKMSSTTTTKPIFLTDDEKTIRKKLKKAFSGGQDDAVLHRKLGGNLDVDVSYQYLCYFLNDDNELERIAKEYKSGEMLSGQLKKITADVVWNFVKQHQVVRNTVTDSLLDVYFSYDRYGS